MSRPSTRPALAILALAASATVTIAAGATTARTKPAAAASPIPADNAIKKLFDAHQFQSAIDEVQKTRAASKSGVADPESEYWAGRSEFALRQFDAARKRFDELVAAHPQSARAPEAAVGAQSAQLAPLSGHLVSDADRAIATRVGRALEDISRRYEASRLDVAAKAAYVAGNAWRLTDDDKAAGADYARTLKLTPQGEYAGGAAQLLGILAARAFEPQRARNLFAACARDYAAVDAGAKCSQELANMAKVGTQAPPFTTETWFNGAAMQPEQLRGRVVLVWFFSTICPHCQATMPQIDSYVQRFKDKPFWVIGITDNTETQTTESARAFIADPKWGITYPVGVDVRGQTTAAWPTTGTPSAILVDKKGVIRWADSPTFLSAGMIDRLLAE